VAASKVGVVGVNGTVEVVVSLNATDSVLPDISSTPDLGVRGVLDDVDDISRTGVLPTSPALPNEVFSPPLPSCDIIPLSVKSITGRLLFPPI
jgi:hypothetical protein